MHFLRRKNFNDFFHFEQLKYQPRATLKFNIPLCRMISLPVVMHFLKNDVMNLAVHFIAYGYMKGNWVFYVALENNENKVVDVTDI